MEIPLLVLLSVMIKAISIMGAGSLHHNTSISVAEAWGMRERLKVALSLGISHLIVEVDNLVINSLKNAWKIP